MGLRQSQSTKMDQAIFELRTVKVTLRNNIQKLRKEQKAIFQRAVNCDITIEEDMLIEQAYQTETKIQEIQNMSVENTLDDVYLTMAFNRSMALNDLDIHTDTDTHDDNDNDNSIEKLQKEEILQAYRQDMMNKLRQERTVREYQRNVPKIPKHFTQKSIVI